MQKRITDDLEALLEALPPHVATPLRDADDRDNLLEVVLDLGRPPEARYVDREIVLSENETTHSDIDYVVSRIGQFGEDNRAGIERTLHRISAIRNRSGRVIGLTCRIGRAVFGTITIIRDLIETGKSALLLGRPGVGKTTMLREVARVLADDFGKRVVIVDTSNEIAGDGDIPHPAIGHARRMQVPSPPLQHAVMIEAVENHMPEVIVIDEIGTELEAAAARTIAERGVQLVGTAHGNTLENLMLNPTLADLIGGIQTVTLSDEEARRRGTQKSVLERKAPPTFDIVVEIQNWKRVAVHGEVASTVDSILRMRPIPAEIRSLSEDGEMHTELQAPRGELGAREPERAARRMASVPTRVTRIYPYGISQSRLEQAVREMQLPVVVTKDLRQADTVLTLKNYYRRKPQAIVDAEAAGITVYVLKSNTALQMEQVLANMYDLDVPPDPATIAIQETEEAIDRVMHEAGIVELAPQNAYIRRLQHQLVEQHHLVSRSTGKEPRRRVRIFPTEGRS